MVIADIINETRRFYDQLDELRSVIDLTQCGFLGYNTSHVNDAVFDIIHIPTTGDVVRMVIRNSTRLLFTVYIDYRGLDEIYWNLMRGGFPVKRSFKMESYGITDEAFKQLLIDIFPYLE